MLLSARHSPPPPPPLAPLDTARSPSLPPLNPSGPWSGLSRSLSTSCPRSLRDALLSVSLGRSVVPVPAGIDSRWRAVTAPMSRCLPVVYPCPRRYAVISAADLLAALVTREKPAKTVSNGARLGSPGYQGKSIPRRVPSFYFHPSSGCLGILLLFRHRLSPRFALGNGREPWSWSLGAVLCIFGRISGRLRFKGMMLGTRIELNGTWRG